MQISWHLYREQSLNSALIVNFGCRGQQDAARWHANVEYSFAMIVEEQVVHTDRALILEKKNE
jgi:hypothetical protein